MTVPSTQRRAGPFSGNGTTTSFPFTFKVFAAEDVEVVKTGTNALESTLVLNSDYSVSMNFDQDASPGGTITYPITGSPLAAGEKLTLVGNLEYEQTTNLTQGGAFSPTVIEDTFDRTVIQIQQLEEEITRALRMSVSTTASGELPAAEAGKLIGWDQLGAGFANYDAGSLFSGAVYADWKYSTFSGDGSTVAYALQQSPGNIANMDVSVGGVTQIPMTDYTLSGSTVNFTTAPPNGAPILLRYGQAAQQVSSTFSVERQTATASQTVFDLTSASYLPGSNNIAVYVNGLKAVSGVDFTEIDSNTVTFASGLTAGDELEFICGRTLNDAVGSESVSFQQIGASATRSVQSKLRDVVSVKDFGAVGDGIADDTAAVQNAIAAAAQVYFPAGTYIINVVTLDANTTLYGDGAASIIKQSASFVGGSLGSLYVNSGSAGSQVNNIVIRDLRVEGTNITAPTFSEFKHLVSLNGVRNALVENVQFIGFQGDGLYIGSGIVAGDERHNTNVIVRNCFFDGINKENRNGISAIDCDGLLVDGNYFTRCTKSTMPGAVDIEPDAYAFHIVRDIKVLNNKFFDIGGNVGAISVFLPGVTYTTAPNGFLIQDNHINTCTAAGAFFSYSITGGVTESTSNFSVKISGNTVVNSARPFNIFNAKDVLVEGNSFLGSTQDALISFNTGNENVLDCAVKDNLFNTCGSVSGNGLSIYKGSRITVDGNTFKDCGTGVAGAANAIDFNTSSTSSFVSLTNNIIVSPTAKTLIAVQTEGSHTLTASTNTYLNNTTGSLTVNFRAENSDSLDESYIPVITGSSSAGTGTYTLQYGRWRRIGKTVFFRVKLSVAAGHTGTGMIQIGLPTTAAAAPNNEETTVSIAVDGASTTGGQIGLINPALIVSSKGAIRCYHTATGTVAQTVIPAGAFSVYASGSYLAA